MWLLSIRQNQKEKNTHIHIQNRYFSGRYVNSRTLHKSMFDYINKFHLNKKKKCLLTYSNNIAEKKSGMSKILSAQNSSIQRILIWGGKQTQITWFHIPKTKRDQNAKEMEYIQSC